MHALNLFSRWFLKNDKERAHESVGHLDMKSLFLTGAKCALKLTIKNLKQC